MEALGRRVAPRGSGSLPLPSSSSSQSPSLLSSLRRGLPVQWIFALALVASVVWLFVSFRLSMRACDASVGGCSGSATSPPSITEREETSSSSLPSLPSRHYSRAMAALQNALASGADGTSSASAFQYQRSAAVEKMLLKARKLVALGEKRRWEEGYQGPTPVEEAALALAGALLDERLDPRVLESLVAASDARNAGARGSKTSEEQGGGGKKGEGGSPAAPSGPGTDASQATSAACNDAAAGGTTTSGSTSPARTTTTRNDTFTRQICYVQTDETELCVYEGTFCFDGKSPIAVVSKPVKDPLRINDFTHSCMDPRYYEPGSLEDGGCAYMTSGERRSFDNSKPRSPSTDTPMSLRIRRWGPLNRNGMLFFREDTPEEVWGTEPHLVADEADRIPRDAFLDDAELMQELASGGAPSLATRVLKEGPFDFPNAPGLRIRRRTRTNNVTVDWVDGALWVAGMDGQWFTNPYHWFSKVGALYEAQRVNSTRPGGFGSHPMDSFAEFAPSELSLSRRTNVLAADVAKYIKTHEGKMPPLSNPNNRLSWKVGAQWDIPPMDFVLFAGDGAYPLADGNSLGDWFRSTLDLAVQPHTRYFFNNVLSQLDQNHIICSRTGVIPGAKNKFFAGRADAWMFRQYAYQVAGLTAKGILSHPMHPPRKITVIDRKGMNGRGIYNRDALVEAVKATGLPYELVPSLGKMSFAEQVSLMAGTGILVAPHGAALANAMFLPAHAVVIEMFPYLMKKNTYRYLCGLLDLHYYPIYSWDLLPHDTKGFYGVDLMNERYFWDNCVATNMSSYDALNVHACNAASKNYPIVVNEAQLAEVLRDALDTIAAYSLRNKAWKEIAEREKIPMPDAPPWVTDTRK